MKHILSCDGGGVRGTAIIEFLWHLEQKIGPLHETFDMFSGTSIGGLIVSHIGILKRPVFELRDMYLTKDMSTVFDKSCYDRMFGLAQIEPKYDGEGKNKTIRKYFGYEKFGNTDKHVMIPAYDLTTRRARFFKSWKSPDLEIYDVVGATTAAPAYFPSWKVEGHEMIDGGVVVNNPAMCAYTEAQILWPGEEIKILSIGTGTCKKSMHGTEDWGGIQWISSGLISILMDQSHVDYQLKELLKDNYIRINSSFDNDEIDNTSKKNIDNLIDLGKDFWNLYN